MAMWKGLYGGGHCIAVCVDSSIIIDTKRIYPSILSIPEKQLCITNKTKSLFSLVGITSISMTLSWPVYEIVVYNKKQACSVLV